MIVRPLTDDAATRTDLRGRDDIARLVVGFYRDAAMDDLLGPVFAAAHVDWTSHIATLTEFWAWQLLGDGDYTGNPLRAHEPVHDRTPLSDAHFERWLDLFTTAVDERFTGPTAELAKARATKMTTAMRRLLNGVQGAPREPTAPMWTSALRRAEPVEGPLALDQPAPVAIVDHYRRGRHEMEGDQHAQHHSRLPHPACHP